MNRDDVIRRIAAETGENIGECQKWMKIMVDGISRCIMDDDRVTITGLGTFIHKAPGPARPKSFGKENTAPSKVKVKFLPSTYLEEAVAQGLNSDEGMLRKEVANALRRGEQVPGYRLVYGSKVVEVEETDPLGEKVDERR